MTTKSNPPHAAEGGAAFQTERAAYNPETPETPTDEDIAALCEGFAEALLSPDYCAQLLRRQSHLLDKLVYTMMDRCTKCEGNRAAIFEWLAFALKIQKQCMDTARAAGTLEYMKAITPGAACPALPPSFASYFSSSTQEDAPPPPPPESGEQTDKET